MVDKRTFVYKTASDLDICMDVYLPAGAGPRPAILWLHGGALIFGARTSLPADQADLYLQQGYVVVAADYRLAPEVKLDVIIEDLRDAYEWVRREGPDRFSIDPDRIAVVGHSAGGYLTLMAGFCVDPAPRALVSFYGYGDIAGAWYSQPDPHYCLEPAIEEAEARRGIGGGPLSSVPFGSPEVEGRWRFYLYCRQQGLWPQEVTGRDPGRDEAWFDGFCPLQNVTNSFPPTLLIHGDQDTDVPFEQSVLMAAELERYGVEHEFIALDGLGHGFDGAGPTDPRVASVFDGVLTFLQHHLT